MGRWGVMNQLPWGPVGFHHQADHHGKWTNGLGLGTGEICGPTGAMEGVSRTWKLISWKDFNVALLTIVNRYNQAQTQTQQKNTVLSGGLFLLKLVKGMVLLPGMQHVSNSHMKFSEAMCESSMFISNTITIITTITAITIITIITVTAITAITSITSIPSSHPWPAPSSS